MSQGWGRLMDKRDRIHVPAKRGREPRRFNEDLDSEGDSSRALIAILLIVIAILVVVFFATKQH